MEEISPSDRSDFALGEEACYRYPAHAFQQGAAIVMSFAEESFSSAAATKHKGAKRLFLVLRAVLRKEDVQVFTRGFRIAKMKLNGLAFLDDVADGNGARLLVRSDEVPDEKIPSLEVAAMFVDDNADM